MGAIGILEIKKLVESTADAAFAVGGDGIIVAWNKPCGDLLGMPATQAVGSACGELLQGVDECGPVCTNNCCVLNAINDGRPLSNFDMQVKTAVGPRWCNVSVMRAPGNGVSWSIHIVRAIDVRKRLEVLVRDFVVATTDVPKGDAAKLLATARSPRQVALTQQEVAVLRLLAKGRSTSDLAAALGISEATVNNHIQHVMKKLDAHTRLEAIRRAELAGLL